MLPLVAGLIAAAHAQQPHWAALHYLSTEPVTEEALRPVVAWVDADGRAVDWYFDSVILYSYTLFHHDGHPTEADLAAYERGLFEDGGLQALADTVAALRVELHDPTWRLGLWLDAVALTGADAPVRTAALRDRFLAADHEELELLGFYWGWNEAVAPRDHEMVRAFTRWAHGQGYEALWIPYYGAEGFEFSRSLGFDKDPLQPSYAFRDVGVERFALTWEDIRAHGLSGVEIELGEVWNPQAPGPDLELGSARQYLWALDHFNWTQSAFNACYHASVLSDYATHPIYREVYDGLFRAVAADPDRRTALDTVRLPVVADTFVQHAVGYEGVASGASDRLRVGTNAYPNALHAYLRFDLAAAPPPERIVGATLRVASAGMDYGALVPDVETWRVIGASWGEDLTARTEPLTAGRRLVGTHRFGTEAEVPAWHAIDVTAALASALQAGDPHLDLLLERRVEDGTEAEVALYSREAGAALAPHLFVVSRPAEPEPDTDTDTASGTDSDAGSDLDSDPDTRAPPPPGCPGGCSTSPGPLGLLAALGALLAARRRGAHGPRPPGSGTP